MSLPQALKPGVIPSNTEQRIDTDILEPVIFTESFIRYQLQNKGILNPKSKITFSIKEHGGHDAFYPALTGVASIVERATLKIGGKTICEVQDWNHLHAYKSMFIDQSVVKEREQFETARLMSSGVVYNDNTMVSEKIGFDLGKEFIDKATATNTEMKVQTFQKLKEQPVFSITLDDLLPVLRGLPGLPLFMIQGQVQIELTLSDAVGKRACLAHGGDNAGHSFTLDQNECRMIADYTFLDGDDMEEYRNKNSYFEHRFSEPRLTRTTLATQADAQNVIRNVGGAGRVVDSMIVGVTSNKMSEFFSASGTSNAKGLLNDYRAIAPEMSAARTYGQLVANVKKNDEFLYPLDRSNTALHFHGVTDTEGAPPHVTRAQYSRQGNSLVTNKFEGYTVSGQNEMTGQFFYNAYKLNDGERVDSRGLELHHKYQNLKTTEAPYTSRCWIELMKVMVITEGVVECYFM
tara:strand:+ start:26 stop:1411 length:1386 start_codon:yes stop_codon:yes gene_type:complete